jgi:hypothetical protein
MSYTRSFEKNEDRGKSRDRHNIWIISHFKVHKEGRKEGRNEEIREGGRKECYFNL